MQIGILECGKPPDRVVERHGDYPAIFARMLARHGFNFKTYSAETLDLPTSVYACDGWLIPGSRLGVYENHGFLPPLQAFIRKAHSAAVPMVGICFGHQVIAKALGGRVEKFQGGWSVGRHVYSFEGLGDLALNAWHQDQVLDAPPGAKTIATSLFCHHAGLAYGDRAWTVQCHPEYSQEILHDMIAARRGTSSIPESQLDTAEMLLSEPLDFDIISAEIARFFKRERRPVQKAAGG
ncbi:type 1 glutamine amidotransferase [Tropicimonas sp. S265A]|uniref:type 1 glutamine amidotransferase n=1 Tax=Tropicimonas sp. S265A TaxID=3415134 RepID=UPI003C7D89B8